MCFREGRGRSSPAVAFTLLSPSLLVSPSSITLNMQATRIAGILLEHLSCGRIGWIQLPNWHLTVVWFVGSPIRTSCTLRIRRALEPFRRLSGRHPYQLRASHNCRSVPICLPASTKFAIDPEGSKDHRTGNDLL